jgi:hypothetical protein
MPAITQLTNLPSIDDPDNFAAEADDFISNQLPNMVSELNTAFNGLTLISTTDTSASSVAIGTGAKSFTVSASKSFVGGMFLMIADTAAPSTNWMYGQVTSYSGTSLVMNITAIGGSGTKTAWTISQSATGILGGGVVAGLAANSFTGGQTLASGAAIEHSISTVASSTTPNIWTATSNVINYTGTTTATGFATAPQAGVSRKLILAGAANFTAGANMLIDGVDSGQSFVGAAGDEVEVTAVTTTQFRLRTRKYNASPLALTYAPVATTSGTSWAFNNIPSWARKITVNVVGFSTNGTSVPIVQIGDSGGLETSGYTGASFNATPTGAAYPASGFPLDLAHTAAFVLTGSMVLTLQDTATNTWVNSLNIGRTETAQNHVGAGSKSLSATLDRLTLTTALGVDLGDGGSVSIMVE